MADARWMPATGRRQVDIGPSLRTALKARKTGNAPPRQSKIPNRDFFAFRYNFKPESVDSDKPGSIDIKRSSECTNVVIERASTKENERHIFKGTELEAKEVECVLIYDEDSGVFTLEKLNSYVNLNHERGAGSVSHIHIANHSASPLNSGQNTANASDDEVLDGVLDSADRNPAIALREEEEEEEEKPVPLAPPEPKPPGRRPQPSLPKPKSNSPKGLLKQAAKPPPKPTPKLKTKKEPESVAQAAEAYDSEHLEFGVPSRPLKKRKVSIPSAPAPPLAPVHVSQTTSQPDSESDEEWEDVTAAAPAENPEANEEAEEEEMEELDLDAFNQEMEMQLEGEEAEEEAIFTPALSPEPTPPDNARKPISLNQFAGGLSPDEDETSSSEDSDED
ncbi:hypothetical protein CONPUDRAFT_153325 [Coniophora puteana RWD-64-598 SS2]|uniref:Transcription elongation factor Eaf N-terminal domain-containing protein n=1 Tax=Coniophora puteana (strain RWD-64-598) TaxID=741705 RepID=A0A5M3MUL6_CONPW|nr:uncharacterized protein CONPUDRAFT_153325 [Coniophora puteana RWD-64-598 SS2]EIW82454.1 hypothetical protein CONPUDRAFT_153325 [Coniophora puteana RWD-64-598 SS2]